MSVVAMFLLAVEPASAGIGVAGEVTASSECQGEERLWTRVTVRDESGAEVTIPLPLEGAEHGGHAGIVGTPVLKVGDRIVVDLPVEEAGDVPLGRWSSMSLYRTVEVDGTELLFDPSGQVALLVDEQLVPGKRIDGMQARFPSISIAVPNEREMAAAAAMRPSETTPPVAVVAFDNEYRDMACLLALSGDQLVGEPCNLPYLGAVELSVTGQTEGSTSVTVSRLQATSNSDDSSMLASPQTSLLSIADVALPVLRDSGVATVGTEIEGRAVSFVVNKGEPYTVRLASAQDVLNGASAPATLVDRGSDRCNQVKVAAPKGGE